MARSPWKEYFGHMHRKSTKKEEPARHPVIVAFSVVSVIGLLAAAFGLRFSRWYFGKVSVQSLCNDPAYSIRKVRSIIPMNSVLSYALALAYPPITVFFIEVLALVVSLDHTDKNEAVDDDDRPRKERPLRGPTLFIFRFLHFVAVHILTLALVSVFVDFTKIAFDWPRPYFLEEFYSQNCEGPNNQRTIPPEEMYARLGFPSHRVALLSAAAVLLMIHVTRTLRGFRSSGPFLSALILGSALASLFCAASVIKTNENRPVDVIVSLIIGPISAAFMASMLPSDLSDYLQKTAKSAEDGTSVLRPPTTIEGLNSVTPMRPAVSWQMPRTPLNGALANRQTVPGFTGRG